MKIVGFMPRATGSFLASQFHRILFFLLEDLTDDILE